MRYLTILLLLFSCSTAPLKLPETSTYGNGIDYWYYANGSLESVIQPSGKCIRYWKNGKIKEELDFKKGTTIIDGKYKSYYESSILKTDVDYKNGSKDGKFKSYCENGSLELDIDYKYGLMDGKYEYYDCNDGWLKEEVDYYSNGLCEGKIKKFISGHQYYEATCANGNITEERYF